MSAQSIHSFILLLFLITKIAVAAPSLAKNDCKSYCGNVSIPYPFGIGAQCSLNKWFEISCNESSSPPTILLTTIQMEVLEISLERTSYASDKFVRYLQFMLVKSPIISQNCSSRETSKHVIDFTGSPFFFSVYRSKFVVAGCNNRATLSGAEPAIIGCQSSCSRDNRLFGLERTCSDSTCCQTNLQLGLQHFEPIFEESKEVRESKSESSTCRLAFIVNRDWFYNNITEVQSMEYVPTALAWGIANLDSLELPNRRTEEFECTRDSEINITNCYCLDGYEGNAYLLNGCQDIDECKDPKLHSCGRATCVNKSGSYECKNWLILGISLGFGVLLLAIGGWWLLNFLKKRRKIKLRKKFFKRMLQQQMFSSQAGIQKAKLFDLKELDKATDHFNKNRILGKGGQGTVYKGMLVNGRIVAIKKSIAIDDEKVEEFINEVVILSQINHRNVVKLLGCCLETEVPLLVYEFISNGTLFQYVHDQTEDFRLPWEMRLRIAIECAEALSYLHSSASRPIYHRDIKTTNILLDEKYRAIVSDFGTSRSLAIDQTHLTTNVQGTFGYLDPEYFESSQFTEKSDVYSYGVVLVELITGKKPVSIELANEGMNLATHFMHLMQENRLLDIVDARIMQQDSIRKEIIIVANLAYHCLSLSRKNRPTMKEVVHQLVQILSLTKGLNAQQRHEKNVEDAITHQASFTWETGSTSTSSAFVTAIDSSLEIEPLVYSQYT